MDMMSMLLHPGCLCGYVVCGWSIPLAVLPIPMVMPRCMRCVMLFWVLLLWGILASIFPIHLTSSRVLTAKFCCPGFTVWCWKRVTIL